MASSRRKSPEAYLPEKKQSQRNPRTLRNLHFRLIRPGCTRLFERGGEKRGRPCPSRSHLSRSHCSSRLSALLRGDLVLEVVGIEAIEPAVGGFGLRIHEEGDRRAARSGQSDIVREVERHPVHLPGPE